MLETLLAALAGFVIHTISKMGYRGVVLLMAVESACIPVPSEIIMPFSGYLASTARFDIWALALAGAVGSLLGSLVAYYVGLRGGRPLLEKYGGYLLITRADLDQADRWFQKYGDWAVFIGRLLPVVRTFISLPAGIARVRLGRFIVLTLVGSYIWCLLLGWIGMKLGEHWDTLGAYFHRFDIVIVTLAVAGAAWYVRRHLKIRKAEKDQ